MRVYIAAPYQERGLAIDVATVLARAGFPVTSRWLTVSQADTDEAAREDMEDVRAADVLVALNPKPWANRGTGGRHFEMGYAVALGKRIVLVGARTNVFHQLSNVEFLDSEEQVLPFLQGLR